MKGKEINKIQRKKSEEKQNNFFLRKRSEKAIKE